VSRPERGAERDIPARGSQGSLTRPVRPATACNLTTRVTSVLRGGAGFVTGRVEIQLLSATGTKAGRAICLRMARNSRRSARLSPVAKRYIGTALCGQRKSGGPRGFRRSRRHGFNKNACNRRRCHVAQRTVSSALLTPQVKKPCKHTQPSRDQGKITRTVATRGPFRQNKIAGKPLPISPEPQQDRRHACALKPTAVRYRV